VGEQKRRDSAQHFVADCVAEALVDCLEMIDLDHQHALTRGQKLKVTTASGERTT
jgi:hypothetical protein